jgi:NADH-quinone oxidoreductase subunit A
VDDYLPILILLILGFLFAALSFVASGMMAPKKRPTAAKTAPYECGIVPGIEPPTRFPVRFYLIAVIFHQLGSFGLTEVVVFAAVVFVSFLFLISNGALTWGPSKRLVAAMPSRTSESTIARITAGPGGPDRTTRAVGTGSADGPSAPAPAAPDAPTTGEPATVPTGPGRAA